jgi:hypothetical protein
MIDPMDNNDSPPFRSFVLLAAGFEGAIAVVAVGLGYLVRQNPLESLPDTPADVAWGALWGTIATLPPLALLWLSLKCPFGPLVRLIRVVDELLVPLFRDCRLLDLAIISALAGLGEEMLFRGVIQQAVEAWLGEPLGIWVGLAVAAVLFGVVHMITPTYALLAGVIGLYLGWIWIATDWIAPDSIDTGRNLLVPIVTHAGYDLLALIYLVRIRRRGTTVDDP